MDWQYKQSETMSATRAFKRTSPEYAPNCMNTYEAEYFFLYAEEVIPVYFLKIRQKC